MRLTPEQQVCGYSAIAIRNLLKKREKDVRWIWENESIARALSLSAGEAARLRALLTTEGYIEDYRSGWVVTEKGNRLCMATARKPIKRQTADRLLAGFIQRAAQVNANSYYLFFVGAAVFGSYLSDAPTLGDVDIAVGLYPKEPDSNKHSKLCEQRSNALAMQWGIFCVNNAFYGIPAEEVFRYLQNRSASLHFTAYEKGKPLWSSGPYREIVQYLGS